MLTFTNPYAHGTPAWNEWEKAGTKTLTPEQETLVSAANAAYDRQDRAWFYNQPVSDLEVLWALVSGVNTFTAAGSWDDEVYDALSAHDWFTKTALAGS